MSPKSLSEQEKIIQREKLLEKGRELLSAYGVRKTSVEDITRAASMAKGTFYQHFDSKEAFFFELIVQYHGEWFHQAELFFLAPGGEPLKERVLSFIRMCFKSPEYLSIFKYHEEIEELILGMQAVSKEKVDDLMQMEHHTYARLLNLFHIDTRSVKPGVIHNYLHAMYFGIANNGLMEIDCMDEMFEVMLNGLIVYIFGGDA